MKKFRLLCLTIIFIISFVGCAFAAPISFEIVSSNEITILEVDMNNIIFHKLNDKIAIEFTSKVTLPKEQKVMINKFYVIPDESKFKITEYAIVDLKKKMTTDNSSTPSEWQTYKAPSPLNDCVNYILNNYEKRKK